MPKPLNEADTFSRKIYKYLERELGYPKRDLGYCHEQGAIRTKAGKHAKRWDAVFMIEPKRELPVLLVEAKAENVKLKPKDITQLQNYAFGERFAPVPPPYLLLSNGSEHIWFKRKQLDSKDFEYCRCEGVKWKTAKAAQLGGQFRATLTLKQAIKLLKNIRKGIYSDLWNSYGSNISKIDNKAKASFEAILKTRQSFINPELKADNERSVKAVLSSVALSWTLKILFLKIISDIGSETDDEFPSKILSSIGKYGDAFPGIMKAAPYDGLVFSKKTEGWIFDQLVPVRFAEALVYEDSQNPIGAIYDGLVDSEKHDIQVKSLGNVYTPESIVVAMCDYAERILNGWKDKKILEPACGSGHFVREVYRRMRLANTPEGDGDKNDIVQAHKKTLLNLRAIDIDPFATQTTQLGIFLELFKERGVWKRLAPNGIFDLGKIVIKADTLGDELEVKLKGFEPTIIIGNPPYGVGVTEEVQNRFGLGSSDSYGCFVARCIDLLAKDDHLLFVLSSSFLTAKNHRELRQKICRTTALRSIHIMHRNAFARRDVFPTLVHLTKTDDLEENHYIFTDAWPVSPNDTDFTATLKKWASGASDQELPRSRFAKYEWPQPLVRFRLTAPPANQVDEEMEKSGGKSATHLLLANAKEIYPLIGGSPALFLTCSDIEITGRVQKRTIEFPSLKEVDAFAVKRTDSVWAPFVKLWQIAHVRQGLSTADDPCFLRKSPWVVANARRRNIKNVNMNCTIESANLAGLSKDQKKLGIEVLDPQSDKYFIPFDKGGEQNTEEGEFRSFWSPVDYWIDWSQKSVNKLRKRALPSNPKNRAYLRNEQFYFQMAIRFTRAGLYAPMYEQSFGGIFSDKGCLIIPFETAISNYLLGYLCTDVSRYLCKNFIQHGVMTEIEGIRQMPIPVPSKELYDTVTAKVALLIEERKRGNRGSSIEEEINKLFAAHIVLSKVEEEEIQTWFKRRYPDFGREKDATRKAEKAARRKVIKT